MFAYIPFTFHGFLLTALGGTRSMYAGKMLEFVREDYSHFQCSVL